MIATAERQTVCWLDMRLAVPADWEIVRHSTKGEQGRLVLIDRRAQRMQLSWLAVERPPDIAHMLEDQKSRDLEDDDTSNIDNIDRVGRWRGYRALSDDRRVTRAAWYDQTRRRLIEIVLTWPDEVDRALERELLDSFECPLEPKGESHWQAFGLDVTAPAEWDMEKVTAKVADSVFRFRRDRAEAILRRRGMTDEWFSGSVRGLVEEELDKGVVKTEDTRHRGHPACYSESREQVSRFRRISGQARVRRDLVWHCPESRAVFRVTTLSRRREPVMPSAFDLRCCGEVAA